MIASDAPKGVRLDADLREVRGAAASPGGAQAAFAPLAALGPVADALASADAPKWTHDAKELERGAIAAGVEVGGVVFDTFLAGYLLDPAAAEYPLRALSEKYLGVDVLGEVDGQDEGQLFGDAGWRAGRRRRGGDRAARARDGGADRQARPPRPARHGRAAARLGPRAHGGAGRGARRRVPGWDGRRGPRPDGGAPGRDLPRSRRGVQPELAAAAPRDPVREARAVAREAHAEGTAVDRRERAGEAAGPSGRRRAARLARAGQAELDVPGSAPAAGRSARRPDPHVLQPGRGGDRPAVVVEPEPAEHPGPHRARPADPAGVHPRRRRPGAARRGLLADRAADPGASVGGRGTAGGVRVRARHPHGHVGARVRDCPRTRWTPPSARGRR